LSRGSHEEWELEDFKSFDGISNSDMEILIGLYSQPECIGLITIWELRIAFNVQS
jgi:hypothetical protein